MNACVACAIARRKFAVTSPRRADDAASPAIREHRTMPAARRELIQPRGDKRFVRRDERGRIVESDDVGRSLTQDRRRQAKATAKPGQGDKGDRKAATTTTRKQAMATKKASKRGATSSARKSTAKKSTSARGTKAASKRSGASGATKSASRRSRAGASARTPNAIQLLKADHATVRELLGKLEKTTSRGTRTREELLARIRREIDVHTTIEEEIFYPALRRAGRNSDDEKMYFEAMEEHRAAGELVLPDLLSTDVASECFGGRAKVLKELIEHHAREEEKEMFPRARELLSAEELSALGESMQARKDALMAQPAPPKSLAGRVLSAVVGVIQPEAETSAGDGDMPASMPPRDKSASDGASSSRASR
jgi:hemerythrin superfamily protein